VAKGTGNLGKSEVQQKMSMVAVLRPTLAELRSYKANKRPKGRGCSRQLLTLTKWSRGVKVAMVAAHAFYSGTAGWGMDGGGCHAAVESGGHPTTVRR
jgi:hypothetical protein